MKRYRRWLVGAGWLLFAAMASLWVRSLWIGDEVAYSSPSSLIGFTCFNGNFWFYDGVRYMRHFDGDGLIVRSMNGPPTPIDRMDEDYFNPRNYVSSAAWGARFWCFVLAGWKLPLLLLLILIRRPLVSIEMRIRVRMRGEPGHNGSPDPV